MSSQGRDWRAARVAPAGTHHVLAEQPLYAERFDEVLPFHQPGLAPVRRGGRGWHIDVSGQPAYAARFDRTFGFYEGLAAVVDASGWYHICPDGSALYAQRYAWCGNYQGGRVTVRDDAGHYLHLDGSGQPAYAARWRYGGDYREGMAVVQGQDGRSTHIDIHGTPVHGCWFVDLDVFHKGFARARDPQGWLHVRRNGSPAYGRRFAMVEPFYNGQARVERHDGALEVIDESGAMVVKMRPPVRSELAELSADMVGFWKTQAIAAAVELGVLEALPGTHADVAARCALVPAQAYRLLRALAELGLVEQHEGICKPSARGAYLRGDHPLTMADAAVEYARFLAPCWDRLPQALASPRWRPPDVFAAVARSAERRVRHHRMLRSYALHDYAAVVPALQLEGTELVLDAGGGVGALAELVLARYPEVQVCVLDRPEVVAQVLCGPGGRDGRHPLDGPREPLRSHSDRLRAVAADLLAPWPVTGNAVILARVLHDWDDDDAARILGHARAALPAGGRLYVIEMLLEDGHPGGSLCDLHLLAVTGGRERAARELGALLAAQGFELAEVRATSALPHLLVAIAQ